MKVSEQQYPMAYKYFSDTLCIGLIFEPIGNADYKPSVGKWNMLTGEIQFMKYEHPKIKKRKRISFAVSIEHEIYIRFDEYL
ncbi:hypothetical protein FACS189414_0720 [Bacteroidia bacterium]|nr:hypothetical protein AGMMS49574_28940 [Bacteroidia bacterium]GHU75816.1 hypothetical protein FACS189414_0720 [Bacteroidia bacterium]